MRWPLLLWLFAFAVNGSQAHNLDIYLRQSSTAIAENAPIKVFVNDLRSTQTLPEPGRNAVTFNRIELGFGYRNFELGYFRREDYALHYTSDTFELLYRDKNNLDIPEGKLFEIFLDAQHVRAEGMRLAYYYEPWSWLKLNLAINALEASNLLYGQIEGQLSRVNGRVAGDLTAAYYYQEDYLLKRQVDKSVNGSGYSLDWGAQVALGQWQAQLDVRDYWGHIRWRDAPYTAFAGSSNFIYVDPNGAARRRPVVSGIETYRQLRQPLPQHWDLTVTRTLNDQLNVIYQREQYHKVHFNRWFFTFKPGKVLTYRSGYDFTNDAVWLGVAGRRFTLNLASDSRSLDRARALSLNIRAHWRL